MIHFDFNGKRVLVTGASRGIGYAVAEGFVVAGADVTLLADDEAVNESARLLEEKHGVSVAAIQCDISDAESVDETLGAQGAVDILINNAGFERMTPVEDPDPEVIATFQRIMDINVVGTFNVTRAMLKQMPDGGSIVNTSSIWGKAAEAGFAAYCASKHAIVGLTKTLAKELGPRNIRVNAICPGWVRTEASMRSLGLMAERTGSEEQALLDSITAAQALPGLMNPEDVVSAYLYLASSAAVNITGQALNVDRGEVMI